MIQKISSSTIYNLLRCSDVKPLSLNHYII